MQMPMTIRTSLAVTMLLCVACGDDSTTGGGPSGGAPSAGGEPAGGAPDEGAGGAGGDAVGGAEPAGGAGGDAAQEAIVFVRGTLFTADMAEAKAAHDAVASGGEAAAIAAGDFAHDTFLGVPLLGTPVNQFQAFDRWTSDENLDAFYADPTFQAAFGSLFAAPPQFESFVRADGWYGWGSLDAGDATEPHYVVVVRGTLAGAPAEIQGQHDPIAEGGEAMASALGDVAHVAYLGRADDHEVLFIDVWTNDDAIEAFYGNPDFQAAFITLFAAPPSVAVFESNDWHQW